MRKRGCGIRTQCSNCFCYFCAIIIDVTNIIPMFSVINDRTISQLSLVIFNAHRGESNETNHYHRSLTHAPHVHPHTTTNCKKKPKLLPFTILSKLVLLYPGKQQTPENNNQQYWWVRLWDVLGFAWVVFMCVCLCCSCFNACHSVVYCWHCHDQRHASQALAQHHEQHSNATLPGIFQ